MARTEITSEIRAELKEKFPRYKFSVTSRDYNEITVALMEAPESPFDKNAPEDGYAQLNHYYIEPVCNGHALKPWAVKLLLEVNEIANKRNWDNSDSQSDYFDVNFYFSLAIGKWNKPFQISKGDDHAK